MKLTRAALAAAGMLALACTEHVATEPKIDDQSPTTQLARDAARGARFEPAGYAVAAERSFGAKAKNANDVTGAEGWDAGEYRYGALSVVADQSAPRSAPTVMQVTYERGHRGGETLARVAKPLTGNTRQLYASLWVKLSSNWRGRGDLAQLWVAGTPRLTLQLDARGSGAPSLLATSAAAAGHQPDVTAASAGTLARGQWHRIELVAKTNTPGAPDGLLDLWVDGTMAITTSSQRYVAQGETDVWQQLTLDPSWGSRSDRVSQTMYMWWDHVYVSGSSSTDAPVFAAAALAAPAAAVDNAIFSDGFESGDLSAWQDGVNPNKQRVLNDSTLAHSGTHVLDMTYPAGQGGGWLTRFFMPGFDSVYVSYWMRLDPNWSGPTKLLDLRGSQTASQWSAFGKAGVCPTGTDFFSTSVALGASTNPLDLSFSTYYPGMPRAADGSSCQGVGQGMGTATYATARRLTVGVWHKVEFWVKLNTIGQSDAVQRMWLDGQLVGEWTGLTLRTGSALALNSLMLDGEGTAAQTEHLYIDDVQVLPAMPQVAPPPAPVAAVSVSLNAPSLVAGQSTQADATLTDAAGNVLTGRALSWSSSTPTVATVDSTGLVKAVAVGTTTIIATAEGISGSATVSVNPPPVATVVVTLNSPSLTTGQSTQAVAALKDASGNTLTGRTIAWSSSSASVARVDAAGLVTSVAPGTTTITATSEGVSGTASLTVVAPPPPPADDAIFSEDFESGTLAAWQDGVDPTKHKVLNDASLAHSGTHVLQMTFAAGGGAGWLTRFFMPGYTQIHARYWMRLQPTWQGSANWLIIRGSRADNQWSSFGVAGTCPKGNDFFATSMASGLFGDALDASFYTYYPGMARQPDGTTCYGQYNGVGSTTYASNRRLSPGVWHEIDFEVKLNDVGQSNGEQRLWLDGALIGQWTGIPFRTDDILRLNSFTLDGHAVAPQTQSLYIDDIQITASSSPVQPPPPAPVASVVVTLNSPSLAPGEVTQATAVTRDASGNVLTGRAITWSSSNTGVATVDANGLVHAVGAGNTTISATSEGITGRAAMSVTAPPPPPVPVATVSVSIASPSLIAGATTQATATLRDASNNVLTGRTVAWSSSNTGVATVNASGLVTAVAAGTAAITATSESVAGSVTVTVSVVPVASVVVTLNSPSLTVGQSARATASLKDAAGNLLTNRVVTWSSSNAAVATVDGTGLVRALLPGTATITATSETISGSAPLTVTIVPVATVTVSLGSSSLTPGQTTQATATTRDASGNVLTGRALVWASTNPLIATVSGSGLVTASTAGTATITATSEGKTGTATLTVSTTPPPPPPDQDEPVFQPGVNTVILGDTFEGLLNKTALLTYNVSLDRWLYNNPGNIEFPSPAGGHSSNNALRINYPASSSYNDEGAVLEAGVHGGSAPYYVVEVWVRTKAGYPWRRIGGGQDGAGEKSVILNQGQSIPRMVLGAGLMPGGNPWGGKYSGQWPSSDIGLVMSFDGPGVGGPGTFWYVQNMNGATRDPVGYLNDGNWHHWTIKLTPGTFQNSTGGNGSLEMWVDGAKVLEYIGSDPSRPEYNQVLIPLGQVVKLVDIGGPFNGAPSPSQGSQFKDYDDLRIWFRQ